MEEARDATRFLIRLKKGTGIACMGDTGLLKKSLETAVCVSYARAFTQTNFLPQPLGSEYLAHLNSEQLVLHDELLRLRNKRYAHTDKTDQSERAACVMAGFEGVLGDGELWVELMIDTLSQIDLLCDSNLKNWRKAAHEKVSE